MPQKKTEIISVINQKGGVGKSTTASALGSGLKQKGYKILFIDIDAQGNLSYTFNAINKPLSTLELLTKTATAEETLVHTPAGDILPASSSLAGADAILTKTGKEYQLKEALSSIAGNYDFIIIDTPPALGILTINALACSDSVIIPAQADVFSLRGIGMMQESIETVKKYCNPNLKVDGILLTRFNARSVLSRDLATLIENTAKELDSKVYKTPIRECISLKEAQAMQTDIFSYAPTSNAGADYMAFIDEFLEERK